MKIKLYLSLCVGMLLLSNALFSQQMSIYRNLGFTSPDNLINGTSSTTYTSSSGSFEIVVKLTQDNYIISLSLLVNSGSSFTCNVYTSIDDVNYNLAGAAMVGTNNYTVNAYAKYIKITANVPSGYIILNELLAQTQYMASTEFAYNQAGNRISRTLIIQQSKSAYDDKMVSPDEEFYWNELGIQIFPNPTTGELRVVFENYPENENVAYELYDFNGKMLLNENMYNNATLISLDSYPDGNYILRFIVNERAKTYQIIKK